MAAFEVLVTRHQGRVRGFLVRLSKEPATADDLAQETFLRAWSKLETFRGGNFPAWILKMAYRLFLNHTRRQSRYRSLLAKFAAEPQSNQTAQASNDSSGRQTALENGWTDLPKLLGVLSPEQRAVFVLSYAQGFSHAEISHILDLPLGTVKSHLQRGKKVIQQRFGLTQEGST